MKALIIEDEQPAAERLVKILKEIDPSIITEGPIDSVSEAIDHLRKHKEYDVIFLDIQLADGKCFNIFDQVKVDIPIIFITAYDEFAIKAFELNSIDYLLKPVNTEKLEKSLKKLQQFKSVLNMKETELLKELFSKLKNSTEKVYKNRFLVTKGETLFSINSDEIAWFLAQDKYVFLVTFDNERYLINYTLEELENKLDPNFFFRINRQYFCSLKSIKKVHTFFNYKLKLDLTPSANEEINVSKNRVSDFKAWLDS